MSPGRVLATMVMGLAGGVAAELIDLAFHLAHDPQPNQPPPAIGWEYYLLGMVLGLCIGVGLGAADGLYTGSGSKFWRSAAYGAGAGLICGYVAFGIAGELYDLLGGDPTPAATASVGGFLKQIVARTSGWAP